MPYARHNRLVTLLIAILAYVVAFAGPTTAATSSAALPSIDAVLQNIQNAFANIQDISGIVNVDQVQTDGTIINAQAKVEALMTGVLRMTFYKPETFADSIFIFDKNANKAITYSPITEQAIHQRIDQVLTDRSVFSSVDQLFSLPSPDDYDLKVIGVENLNGVSHVMVTDKSKNGSDSMGYQFWINQQTWLATKLLITDQKSKPVMTITITNVKTNTNLKEATLKKLPPGTQVING